MMKTPQTVTADELAGVRWRISSFSGDGSGGSCVQAGDLPDGRVLVRHSHHPDGAMIVFTPDEWTNFVKGVHNDEFDF